MTKDCHYRIRELFRVSTDQITELIGFKNTTNDAYKYHFKNILEGYEAENIKAAKKEYAQIMSISKTLVKSATYPNIIFKTALIYGVSSFEVFFGKFLTILYEEDVRTLKSSKKTMTYEEILSCKSMKGVKQKMITTILHEFFYKSISEQMTEVCKKFGFDIVFIDNCPLSFFDKKISLAKLSSIFSLRNIILHNDSIVNEIFLKQNASTSYKLGEKIILTHDYTNDCLIYLLEIITKLCYQILGRE